MAAVTGSAFAITFGYYCIALIVCVLIFSILRNKKLFKRFYAPKNYLPNELVDGQFVRPPPLPRSLFTWAGAVLSYDQRQVLAYGGMDALTMMRVLYFGLVWSLWACLFCLGACLPTNLVGDEIDKIRAANSSSTLSSLDEFTMANIPSHDNKVIVHVVVTYILSIIGLYMLYKWHKEAVGLRINYLASRPKGAESNTILITDIPGIVDGTILDRALFAVPEDKRRVMTDKMMSAAGGVTSSGAGCMGKLNNAAFDCCLGVCAKAHSHEPLPVTRYNAAGEPTYAEPMALPPVIDMQADSAAGRGQVVEYVAGIPLAAELGAWPKANRMIASGMAPAQMVDAECKEVFGNDYVESQLVYNTSAVEGPYNEYETRHQKMLDTFDGWAVKAAKGKLTKKNKPLVQPTTRVIPQKMGKWGVATYGQKPSKVGLVDFNVARMDELAREIKAKQIEARNRPASAAFATFDNRVTQTLAATALMHHDTNSWQTKDAPAPNEVLWANMRWRSWERTLRKVGIWGAYVALVLLFMIPVTALQGMLGSVSWFDWLTSIGPLNALYSAVFPTIVLKIFMFILPVILRKMTYVEGVTSVTELDLGLETKYYGFQYVVIFLTTLIGGALLNQIQDFIDDPGSIVEILGRTIPSQAIFFTTLIMLEAMFTTPFALTNLVGAIIYKIKCTLFASERARARAWQDQYASYGKDVGSGMFSFLLIMVCSPIFPIMAAFGVVWYLTAIIVWKYKLCYVWRPACESGGRLWPRAYWQIVINLTTMQLLVCFVVAVKKNTACAIALAPLIVFTPIFGVLANKRFKRPLAIMSLRAAATQDVHDASLGVKDDSSALGAYVQPVMRDFDDARHEEFKAEAARWQALFASGTYNPKDFELPPEEDPVPNSGPSTVVKLKSVKKGDPEAQRLAHH